MSSRLPKGCKLNSQGLVVTSVENLSKIIAEAEIQARLVELDLLEQAINTDWDMYEFKMQRLHALENRLYELTNQKEKP